MASDDFKRVKGLKRLVFVLRIRALAWHAVALGSNPSLATPWINPQPRSQGLSS